MAKELVSDALWAVIEPLLPPHRAQPGTRGRPPVPDRAVLMGILFVLMGILFVLKSGIPSEMLPTEMGCGSGRSCWRRLRDWHKAGVWQRLHELLLARLQLLLARLQAAPLIDWSRVSVDAIFVRAKGAKKRGLQARRSARRLWTGGAQARSAIRR